MGYTRAFGSIHRRNHVPLDVRDVRWTHVEHALRTCKCFFKSGWIGEVKADRFNRFAKALPEFIHIHIRRTDFPAFGEYLPDDFRANISKRTDYQYGR